MKAVIDAGLTCPNIDGSRGRGGCIFCDGGSGYFTAPCFIPIAEQIQKERERIWKKDCGIGINAYFQAHTNTYCSPQWLDYLISEAISCEGVAAVSVATRPDCLDDEKIAVLKKYSELLPLSVELGLQTIHESTAVLINRCYSIAEFEASYFKLKVAGIRVCIHIIDGLPHEDRDMMIETASYLGQIRPDGVKIHLLHVIKGTKLAELYESGQYSPMEFKEYIDTVILQLERLSPETVIERITGDGDKDKLLAPIWSKDKIRVLGSIDKRIAELDTWQGRLFEAPVSSDLINYS